MSRQTFSLGRLFDVRVGVHISWFAVYAFMTFALAHGLTMLPRGEAYVLGALCALALFASVVVHELAHALVARRFGVRTDAITLFLFGGVATLVEEPRTPFADACVALAGPAASAALAFAAFGALSAVERLVPGTAGGAAGFVGAYLVLANAVLAAFNLLPAYPMDGGRILRAYVWHARRDRAAATMLASRIGIIFALAFVAAGCGYAIAQRHPMYLWYAVLGVFLAGQGFAQERFARRSRRAVTV